MKRNVPAVFECAPNTHSEPRPFILGETTGSAEDVAYSASLPLRGHLQVEAEYGCGTQHRRILELWLATVKRRKAGHQ